MKEEKKNETITHSDKMKVFDTFINQTTKYVKLQMDAPEQMAIEISKDLTIMAAKMLYKVYQEAIAYHQEHANEYTSKECEEAMTQLEGWKDSILESDILSDKQKEELFTKIEYAQSAIRNRELDLNDPTRIAAKEALKKAYGDEFFDEKTLDALSVLSTLDRDGNGEADFIDCIKSAYLKYNEGADKCLVSKQEAETNYINALANGENDEIVNQLASKVKRLTDSFDSYTNKKEELLNRFIKEEFDKVFGITNLTPTKVFALVDKQIQNLKEAPSNDDRSI